MAFLDDFTGTTGDYLSSRSGWTLVSGTAGTLRIDNNQLRIFSSTESLHTCTDQGSADCYVQNVQAFTAGTTSSSFVCLRISSVNGFIGHRYNSNANGWQVYKRTGAASFTNLGSYVPGSTSGTDVAKLVASGNSISLYINGTLRVGPVTESYNNTQTATGFVTRVDGQNPWIDDFEAGALSAGPTYTLTAAQGSYTLTGQAAALPAARKLTAAQGSYALTGYDATLTYTPVSGATYTLTAAQGNYGLTGNDAALTAARKLTADQGSYTLTGYDAAMTYTHMPNYTLTAGSGSYTLTGQDTAFKSSRALTAEQGAYTYTGFSATLTSSADAQQSAVEQVAGGWWNSYNSEMQRREAAKAKKKKLKEELDKIEDKLDKEIIIELSKKEKEKERFDELRRLSKLAQDHKREISQIMDDRIVMAVDRAITVGSYSAMEQMEREISKVKEEMEFLSMATEILINQYYLN